MKYHLTSRILHWLMAFLIIANLAIGFYMKDFIANDAQNRFEIYDFHKSIGVLVIILLVFRIINRHIHKAPALPESFKKLDVNLAKIGHISLYILMLIVPVSGYLMSSFAGYPVKFFGVELPAFLDTNFTFAKICSEAHEISAIALIALIAIHILAIFKHRFFDKTKINILKRMI